MNSLTIYQVDAFASSLFKGNPAAVCPLNEWLTDAEMQAIAAENNLSETAFFVPEGNGFRIRWMTPNEEVALCGHATLASAYIIFEKMGYKEQDIRFNSLSGELIVKKSHQGLVMNFPALPLNEIVWTPEFHHLNLKMPYRVFQSQFDLMFVYEDALDVKEAIPDLSAVARLDYRGLILTAPGTHTDVYSRCFYPGCDVPEDPVTGSAHCVIAPYWCKELNKSGIHALQGGRRQGELYCEIKDKRVLLYGNCHLYMEGRIYLP
ncbi:PhzF family phenazine biosynthesis protein [Legionella bononiensis]|uniref:PhzF family phenazine biosynthesis protein n=1 Tax=Legionella bononiensis TaxID=2793102 RepID=A0ABS1WBT2_9GAMM|nr:PhzF family phenazine biosynthesis protein [Legionella bononiensis]MBL7481109.1 PhzF family phenazine biosynthesis protein [Legionella bononiensis]MBL7526818.1 PhzF family phenazine biosynthesis protein [Legionella bononiensis]MBL7564225.1 PhzF family phenazine biosynthesis protein [Legionella bononiensis]